MYAQEIAKIVGFLDSMRLRLKLLYLCDRLLIVLTAAQIYVIGLLYLASVGGVTASFVQLCLLAGAAGVLLYIALALRHGQSRPAVAAYIESNTDDFADNLQSATSFISQLESADTYGCSAELMGATFNAVIPQIKPCARYLNLSFLRLRVYPLLAVTAITTMVMIFDHTGVGNFYSLLAYGRTRQQELSYLCRDMTACTVLERGRPLQLKAYFPLRRPRGVTVVVTMAGAKRELPLSPAGRNQFSFRIATVRESFSYQFLYDGHRSKVVSVQVLDAPLLTDMQITKTYPEYTGLAPEVIKDQVGEIEVLKGGRLSWQYRVNQPLVSAQLQILPDSTALVGAIDNQLQAVVFGDYQVLDHGRYAVTIENQHGLFGLDSSYTNIRMIADRYPVVAIARPGVDMQMPEEMVVELDIRTKDDFGVVRVSLYHQVEGDAGKFTEIELPKSATSKQQQISYRWDLTGLDLFPGETVVYYARCWDNDAISGAKAGISTVYRFNLPTIFDLYEESVAEMEMQRGDFKGLVDQHKRLDQMTNELLDKMDFQGEENPGQHDAAMQKLREKMLELQTQALESGNKLDNELNKMAEQQLLGSDAVSKLERIKELVRKVGDSKLNQAIADINQALKEVKLSEKKKALLRANFNEQEYIARLDRTIKMLEQMQTKNALKALAREAEDLLNKQSDLNRDARESERDGQANTDPAAQRNAQRQQDLAKRAEELREQIADLSAAVDGELQQELAALEAALAKLDTAAKMRKLAADMQAPAPRKSQSKQRKEVLQGLAKAADKLSQINFQQQEQESAQSERLVRQIIGKGLIVSEDQELVFLASKEHMAREVSGALTSALAMKKEVTSAAALVADNLGRVADDVELLLLQTTLIDESVPQWLSGLVQQIAKSNEQLRNKSFAAVLLSQQQTYDSINRFVYYLMHILDQLQKQQNSNQEQQAGDKMGEMAGRQQGVNEGQDQLNEDVESRPDGSVPQEQLNELAFEQELISQTLESMMDQYQRNSELGKKLGQVGEQLEQLKGALKRGAHPKEIAKMQKQLYHRMLDAEKALKKQKSQSERKARVARHYEAPNSPENLDKNVDGAVKKDYIPDSFDLDAVPARFRGMVKKYFVQLGAGN